MMVRGFRKIGVLFQQLWELLKSTTYHRDKRIVLFGAWFGERFADNSRYLYQYLHANKEKYGLSHVVWVTRNAAIQEQMEEMGYESYLIGTNESTKYHKKAGMHVVCNVAVGDHADIDVRWSCGAVRINLWHGVGVLKGLEHNSQEYKRRKAKRPFLYSTNETLSKRKWYRVLVKRRGGWGDYFFLSPTSATTQDFEKFTYLPQDQFIQAAYPRTCKCEKLLDKESKLIEAMRQYRYIVLYAPTFSQSGEKEIDTSLLYELKGLLEDNDILWIQKAHSASSALYEEADICNNILTLESQFDLNTILPYISVLITDFSSVAMDARYFEKPVLFYIPDYEAFRNGDFDFTNEKEILYGPRYYDLNNLGQELLQMCQTPDLYIDAEYKRIRKKYWGEKMDMNQIWSKICETTRYRIG